MSETYQFGEPKDVNALFDELVSGLEEERRDPQITALLDSALEVEVELNKLSNLSDDTIFETLAALNDDLEQCGVLGAAAAISGRLRPALAEGEDDETIEALLPPTLSDLGPLQRDARGPYFQVVDRNLLCGAYDLRTTAATGFDGSTKPQHELILNFNHDPDQDTTSGELYAYLDDIDLLVPDELSAMKIYDVINDLYPEIATQIEALPANSKKDRKIIQALADFTLEIDWSKYPRHEQSDREQLLTYIEIYITNRVQLDNNLYALSVEHALSAVDDQNQTFTVDLDEPTDIVGTVEQVRLLREESDGGIERYAVTIEILASAHERHSGSHTLYIPAAHIGGVRNLRNSNLFKGKPKPAVTEKTFIEDTILPLSHATDAPDEVVEQPAPAVGVSNTSLEALGVNESVEEDLEKVSQLYARLLGASTIITDKVFDTQEEAERARDELDEVFTDFYGALPENRVLVEVAGPGVYAINARWNTNDDVHVDSDAGNTSVTFHDTTPLTGDPLAVKKGIYTGRSISAVALAIDDAEKFRVRAFMVFYEPKDEEPIRFGVPEMNLPMFTLTPSREFFVDVNSHVTSMAIPEYARISTAREAIAKIADTYPDLSLLPAQLTELHELFINSNRSEFRSFENVELLNDIGLSVGGDEEACEKTSYVLNDMFAEREVMINGAIYNNEGQLEANGYVAGQVKFVVPTASMLPVTEPMLVIEDDGDISYVPLSTITSMRY